MSNKYDSVHIDYAVSKNCSNPDSYGMICVKCGQCGREFTQPALDKKEKKNG